MVAKCPKEHNAAKLQTLQSGGVSAREVVPILILFFELAQICAKQKYFFHFGTNCFLHGFDTLRGLIAILLVRVCFVSSGLIGPLDTKKV